MAYYENQTKKTVKIDNSKANTSNNKNKEV